MAKEMLFRFRRGDLLAIGLVIALAVCVATCFLPQKDRGPGVAEIYLNGEKVKTVSLDQETVFAVSDQYTNEITVSDGAIAITRADCPGGDCVHSGAVSGSGRSIVCLPNGLEIRVVAAESDVDFVVR